MMSKTFASHDNPMEDRTFKGKKGHKFADHPATNNPTK
jgi:hypothetical protein